MQTFMLSLKKREKSEASDSMSEGSLSMDSCSEESEDSNKPPSWMVVLHAKPIDVAVWKRKIIKYSLPDHINVEASERTIAIPITFSILVCKANSKILGVSVVILDPNHHHESGIFFQVDPTKWPRIEDN